MTRTRQAAAAEVTAQGGTRGDGQESWANSSDADLHTALGEFEGRLANTELDIASGQAKMNKQKEQLQRARDGGTLPTDDSMAELDKTLAALAEFWETYHTQKAALEAVRETLNERVTSAASGAPDDVADVLGPSGIARTTL